MRRLTKIRKSVYESESYAVYISRDGENFSAIEITAIQTQQVLDKLAMYEDLDALGLVRRSNSLSGKSKVVDVPTNNVEDTQKWIEEKIEEINEIINELKRGLKNET